MTVSLVYELRQKPTGRGWGAYLTTQAGPRDPSEWELDQLFADRLRLSELPQELPWIGALRLPSGPWIVAWHEPSQPRLPAVLVAPDEWQASGGDVAELVAAADAAFAQSYLAAAGPDAWASPTEAWPGYRLGSRCTQYLPLALSYLRRLRQERGAPFACATAWRHGVPRPSGLEACPFEVVEDGPQGLGSLVEKLRGEGALVQAQRQRPSDADGGETKTSAGSPSLQLPESEWQELRHRLLALEQAGERRERQELRERPEPPAPNLGPVLARLDEISGRLAALEKLRPVVAQPPDAGAVARVAAVESSLRQAQARLDELAAAVSARGPERPTPAANGEPRDSRAGLWSASIVAVVAVAAVVALALSALVAYFTVRSARANAVVGASQDRLEAQAAAGAAQQAAKDAGDSLRRATAAAESAASSASVLLEVKLALGKAEAAQRQAEAAARSAERQAREAAEQAARAASPPGRAPKPPGRPTSTPPPRDDGKSDRDAASSSAGDRGGHG